jgi:hypothetical protein
MTNGEFRMTKEIRMTNDQPQCGSGYVATTPFQDNARKRAQTCFPPRIPKGFRPKAQGCAPGATLGNDRQHTPTPTGLRPSGRHVAYGSQPRWGWEDLPRLTQGRREAPLLGFGPQSLCDCQSKIHENLAAFHARQDKSAASSERRSPTRLVSSLWIAEASAPLPLEQRSSIASWRTVRTKVAMNAPHSRRSAKLDTPRERGASWTAAALRRSRPHETPTHPLCISSAPKAPGLAHSKTLRARRAGVLCACASAGGAKAASTNQNRNTDFLQVFDPCLTTGSRRHC